MNTDKLWEDFKANTWQSLSDTPPTIWETKEND